ncbi:uncharacterized protein LOC103314319 isoform X1 [Tribolium castaneum]|nr:PREDICTED: uncharacterized protein LOC107398659 [Tribolium castaneum]|eukprot:XP_015839043.1 PREDICTED: uncharacterized protein LOC107398659 [Tribolium castaneum]
MRGKNSVSQSRLVFITPSTYSNKVLIGPWVYDRLNAQYSPPEHKDHVTTYRDHFQPKQNSGSDLTAVWDQKLKSEDSNFIPQTGRSDFPNYFDNFSSIYDLSFNHFPKCLDGRLARKRQRNGHCIPLEEYLPTFGNMTQFGLVESKQEQWKCETQDPRRNKVTHYSDHYAAPELSAYKFKRFAIPLANSSIMDATNLTTMALNLRNRPTFKVVPPQDLVPVPRPPHLNPITWECIPEKPKVSKKCI